MKEQLELKHIEHYALKGVWFMHEGKRLKCKGVYSIKGYWYLKATGGVYDISECKLILRPLSDLNKLGVKGIEINEHTINMLIGNEGGYGEVEFSHYKGVLDLTVEGDSDQRYDSSKTIDFNTFEKVRVELLKGHYDIYNLIEKGLAYDINKLEQNVN